MAVAGLVDGYGHDSFGLLESGERPPTAHQWLQWIVVGLVLSSSSTPCLACTSGPYWPMVLVAVGLWLLIRTFLRDRG